MTGHKCDSGNFDRTICPEPCGTMHSYCDTCGERQDPCAHDLLAQVVRAAKAEAWDEGWNAAGHYDDTAGRNPYRTA